MCNLRPLLAVLLCGAAAHAQELQPLIDRPVTQPRGAVELTAHGTYTNWDARAFVGPGTGSLTGETLALGADFGATDLVELGLATALPINPGAAFGSILGSAAFAVDKAIALRVDAGFENFGVNGDNTGGSSHISRYFAGLGARIKVPISPNIAFVTGRTGAIHFGHFNNVGFSGVGLYNGASRLTEASSDVLVLSGGGDRDSQLGEQRCSAFHPSRAGSGRDPDSAAGHRGPLLPRRIRRDDGQQRQQRPPLFRPARADVLAPLPRLIVAERARASLRRGGARVQRCQDLVVAEHPGDRDRHVAEREGVHLLAVHRVDAVRRDDDAVVARIRLECRAQNARIRIDPGEDQRSRGELALQHEIEVRSVEAVVALLAIDDHVARVEQLRDRRSQEALRLL